MCPRPTWTTCATASPAPAGPTSCPASAGPAGCRSATSRSWPPTGPTATTGASRKPGSASTPQFTTVDGATIHFLHVRSPQPDALPLILTDGWPGSIVEFLNVIGPPPSLALPHLHAAQQADGFEVTRCSVWCCEASLLAV